MSRVVIFRARHVMIAMGLMAAFLGNASASPKTITVQRPTPVAEAVEELDKRYGTRILPMFTMAILPMCRIRIGLGSPFKARPNCRRLCDRKIIEH